MQSLHYPFPLLSLRSLSMDKKLLKMHQTCVLGSLASCTRKSLAMESKGLGSARKGGQLLFPNATFQRREENMIHISMLGEFNVLKGTHTFLTVKVDGTPDFRAQTEEHPSALYLGCHPVKNPVQPQPHKTKFNILNLKMKEVKKCEALLLGSEGAVRSSVQRSMQGEGILLCRPLFQAS